MVELTFEHIIPGYIFAGLVAAFYNALFIFISPRKIKKNLYTFFLLLTCAFISSEHLLTKYHFFDFDFKNFPISTLILSLIKSLKVVIGPILFFSFSHFLKQKRYHFFSHLLPGISTILLLIVLYIVNRISVLSETVNYTICITLDMALLFHMSIYFIYIFVIILQLLKQSSKEYRRKLYFFLLIMLLSIFTIPLSVIGAFGGTFFVESYALCLVSTVIFLLLSLTTYYPELLGKYQKELKQANYKRSLLRGIDKHIVKERLLELMDNERLYSDEDLTLQKLATIMDLSPHQLSEFLNVELGLNFGTFINGYRVNEAKEQLLSYKNRSIIDIAFSSGFNSKSTFYTVFKESTGVSPKEYRETVKTT